MDNEQFKEFIRQLKEYIKNEHEKIQGIKESVAAEALIDKAVADERFWRFIADEMDKRIGESKVLGGLYNIDIAKKMFTAIPKEQIITWLMDFKNQQDASNQECI